jgi:hypothetical protein
MMYGPKKGEKIIMMYVGLTRSSPSGLNTSLRVAHHGAPTKFSISKKKILHDQLLAITMSNTPLKQRVSRHPI